MTLSGIPGRLLGKLYTKFQLEETKKELEQKLEVMQILLMEMGVAVKDDAFIAVYGD